MSAISGEIENRELASANDAASRKRRPRLDRQRVRSVMERIEFAMNEIRLATNEIRLAIREFFEEEEED